MRLPKLDNRLACIYEMIGDAKSVCDIGADHGKLALSLAKNGVKVIATDISEPSLKKTKRLANLHNADIDTRVGDGLQVIEAGEADIIVIAGMGQNTIIDIIEAKREVINACEFILIQSMNGDYDLRSFLAKEVFAITDEVIAKEGRRVYCIIKAKPTGGRRLSELEKYLGPVALSKKNGLFDEYLRNNINILSDIILGMERAGDTKSQRYVRIKKVLEEMKVMK